MAFCSNDLFKIRSFGKNSHQWVLKTNKTTANDYEGTIDLFGMTFWFTNYQNSNGWISTMDYNGSAPLPGKVDTITGLCPLCRLSGPCQRAII